MSTAGNFSITQESGAADWSISVYLMRYGEWTPLNSGHTAGATDAVGRGVAGRNPRAARPHSRTRRNGAATSRRDRRPQRAKTPAPDCPQPARTVPAPAAARGGAETPGFPETP